MSDWREIAKEFGVTDPAWFELEPGNTPLQRMAEEIVRLRARLWLLRPETITKTIADDNLKLERDYSEKLRGALTSISKNSCCQPCREAGLWAKEALAIPRPGEAK